MSGYESNRFYTSLERDRFVLPPGEFFMDVRNKLRIKTLDMHQNGIAIEIAFGAPNLVISTPKFTWPRQVVRGDTLAIPFVIENSGVADIRDEFDVALSIAADAGSERILSKRLSSLRKDEQKHLQFFWIVENKSESVTLQLFVDHKNEIEELNKDDNFAPRRSKVRVYLRESGDLFTETGRYALLNQPKRTRLMANYPNPFNSSTTIAFELPTLGEVNLTVFDLLGRHVATLVNEELAAGLHRVQFDGSKLTSGIYVYHLQTGEHVQTRKLMLVK
jgi:hypothetical protein